MLTEYLFTKEAVSTNIRHGMSVYKMLALGEMIGVAKKWWCSNLSINKLLRHKKPSEEILKS